MSGETTPDNTELIYTISAIDRELTRKLMERFRKCCEERYAVQLSNAIRKNSTSLNKIFLRLVR